MSAAATTSGKLLVMGALLGFSLSRIGFTSYDEVNAMFTARDFRLYEVFGLGVVLLTAAFAVIARTSKPAWAPRPIHRGTVLGGVLFGLGWALSGACPGVVLAQLGEGRFYALFMLAGVAIGNWAYGALLEQKLGTASRPSVAAPAR
ncbi:MAG: YeeE/YedE thiosulfate transporter family protein [Sandaracinus sp.]